MKSRTGSSEMHRRQFLQFSSAAVLGMAAGGLLPTVARADETTSPLLSIGYADSYPEGGKRVALMSASSLLTGDASFLSRRATIAICGNGRSGQHDNPGINLDAVFPVYSRTEANYARFRSWSFSDREDGTSYVAGGSKFTMPVTANGIQFILSRNHRSRPQKASDAIPELSNEREMVTLSLGTSSGAPKLQRGIYVFALREDAADAQPTWDRLYAEWKDSSLVVPNARFSYVAVAVDYLNKSE